MNIFEADIPAVLAYAVVLFALPVNWYVAYRLWRLSRSSPELRVLADRAIAAFFLAVIVSVFAVVFINNDIIPPPMDVYTTRILTRGAILSLVVPALYWLYLYRSAPEVEKEGPTES